MRGVKQLDRPGFGERIHDWTGGVLPDRFSSIDLKPWFFTIVVLVLITIFVNSRLRDSKMGRAWIAVREDEVAASAMGIPLMRTKLWAYAIGAVFGGIAGAYYGSFIGSVFPTSFFFNISVLMLCMVIVGGMGNIYGVIVRRAPARVPEPEGAGQDRRAASTTARPVGINEDDRHPEVQVPDLRDLLVVMMLLPARRA